MVIDEKLQHIRNYLQGWIALAEQGGHKGGMFDYYELILKQGTEFRGFVPSKTYPDTDGFRKSFKPKIKQCFYNSQMFVLTADGSGCRYFEGYAFAGILPFHHGWVVMPDGKVIDFTLETAGRRRDRAVKQVPSEVAYLGVEVPVGDLRGYVLKYKMSSPYAHMYYLGANEQWLGD